MELTVGRQKTLANQLQQPFGLFNGGKGASGFVQLPGGAANQSE